MSSASAPHFSFNEYFAINCYYWQHLWQHLHLLRFRLKKSFYDWPIWRPYAELKPSLYCQRRFHWWLLAATALRRLDLGSRKHPSLSLLLLSFHWSSAYFNFESAFCPKLCSNCWPIVTNFSNCRPLKLCLCLIQSESQIGAWPWIHYVRDRPVDPSIGSSYITRYVRFLASDILLIDLEFKS